MVKSKIHLVEYHRQDTGGIFTTAKIYRNLLTWTLPMAFYCSPFPLPYSTEARVVLIGSSQITLLLRTYGVALHTENKVPWFTGPSGMAFACSLTTVL